MPKGRKAQRDDSAELLQKLLVLQLYDLGATQDKIAKVVGRQKKWVNELLKGLPNRGVQRA